MIIMIENYDSFSYNVEQYFSELGAEFKMFRNDEISASSVIAMQPERLLISPGPRSPEHAGISNSVIKSSFRKIPILGICLGHQCIGHVFDGKIIPAKKILHGKASLIHHDGIGIFKGIPSPFQAARYNSLVVDSQSLPNCLEISAWTQNDDGSLEEIMGLRHKDFPLEGVQFHPESVISQFGHDLFRNFLGLKQ